MLLWIKNAPKYGKSDCTVVEDFVDKYTTCSEQKGGSFQNLINYQTHRHAPTCKKKNKLMCRFGFPLPPMPKTTILEPLAEEEQADFTDKYKHIVDCLNEMKLGENVSFEKFLKHIDMTFEDYIKAIQSSLTGPKIFLKRNPSEIRINAYNTTLLKSWEANIDVQYILDAYACAAYIASYISKGQSGMSNLMMEACNEAQDGNKDLRQQVRHIGNKFLTHVELCAQEAAYLVLQLPLRRSSRRFVFINTSEPTKRTFLLKPLEVLEDMPRASTQIESDNNIKRYSRRLGALKDCCLADFMCKFDIIPPKRDNPKKNRSLEDEVLPETENFEIDEEILEDTGNEQNDEDQLLMFMDSDEKEICMKDGTIIRKRGTCKIMRCFGYSKEQDEENYYREQLMLYFPWRNEQKD